MTHQRLYERLLTRLTRILAVGVVALALVPASASARPDRDARADQEGVRYWWVEGNGACDCNRHLLFERAAGREPPADERGCSTGLYTAALVHDDGELEPATPWPP